MFEKDCEIKSNALILWANFIETGNPCMSANDAINCGEQKMIKSLDDYQRKFISRLRELSIKELNGQ